MSVKTRLPLRALQAAIIARMRSDLPTVPVFDHTIENRAFPYVSLASMRVSAGHTKTCGVVDVEAPIHCWSTSEGQKEVQGIADDICQSLTDSDVTLSDSFRVIDTALVSADLMEPEDSPTGLIRHCVLTMRFKVQDVA